jgi:hypothetical protein
MKFRSVKNLLNRLRMDSVIPRKKVLITRAFRGPWKSPFRSSERSGITPKKLVLQNSQNIYKMIFPYLKSSIFCQYLENSLMPKCIFHMRICILSQHLDTVYHNFLEDNLQQTPTRTASCCKPDLVRGSTVYNVE